MACSWLVRKPIHQIQLNYQNKIHITKAQNDIIFECFKKQYN
jgi:hypothetical protein